ncbi:MAG: FHA domain-containing protein [Polyangiaceae bacterium]|nr:FHA domain-containing protein [Polyangiaceae bacterium]
MKIRPSQLLAVLSATLVALFASRATAAPEAKILRIDPRAAQTDGAPIITTVVEVAQRKRVSEATADCAYMRGDAQLVCMGEKLAQPRALFAPFPLPPKENMIFTVQVDGADQPAKYVDAHKWDQGQNIKGVGTAWLIVIDAAGSMGARFGDAQAVALAFINAMGPQDIGNVTVIGERGIVADSKWQPAAQRATLAQAVTSAREMAKEGRGRPLMTTIRAAATDAFKDLGSVGSTADVPLHQAMVVLSNGAAGGDVQTNGAGATQLSQYLTKGRFPEENPTAPKMPLPVISILMPTGGMSEEFTKNAQDFMANLANPDIGGYFGVVRGNGQQMGPAIVSAVRDRFNQMYVVRWRVSCVAPTVLQTFNLVFKDVNPPIAPDGYKDVPVGIDPTVWPLDVNVAYTVQMAKRDPVAPGGKFKVYGDFCWGSDAGRAQVYFIPKNQAPPASAGRDVEKAKQAQQQLVAMKMEGKALKVADTFAEFEAPASENIILGKGEQAVSRIVIYDSKARRMSGVTATTILTLKAGEKSIPIEWIVAGGFGAVILVLLIIVIARGGGGGGRRAAAAPAPAPLPLPGQAPPPATPGYAPQPYVGAGTAPQPYTPPAPAAPAPYQPAGPAPGAAGGTAVLGAHGAPAQANPEFMYGNKPPQYGLTAAQPQAGAGAAPPDPYGAASRATLSGSSGVFTVLAGSEMRVGRDPSTSQIVLGEARVSSHHATVKLEGGQLLVRDERSNNGTHVNGTKLTPGVWMPVPPGSIVRFGPVELSVKID